MTDDSIEAKALALINEERAKTNNIPLSWVQVHYGATAKALCRAIEQHEAFKQEVSDTVHAFVYESGTTDAWDKLNSFIIHKPKPDPLVQAMNRLEWCNTDALAKDLRAELEAFGLEIREKGR
jgi:hypothetical protein